MNSFNLPAILEKLHSFISAPMIFAVLGLLCIVFAVASWVLVFHWNKYAIDKSSIIMAQAVYFLGGVLIMFMAIIAAILY